VADVLAGGPIDKKSLRVKTAERIMAQDEAGLTHFRLPMERAVRHAVYGEDAHLFGPRREGVVGHAQGKAIVRCGIEGL
ncbi:glycosyltransferase family 2 protein, partial [Tritonibacter sp. SIMBA_163]